MDSTSRKIQSHQKKSQINERESVRMDSETESDESRGYMAIYHDIEEICYGPELGLSAKERVFLCLRHKLLRDGLCQKLVGKAFIQEKTKLSLSQIDTAIKKLEENEVIVVHRTKVGNQCLPNKYELNPKKFGNIYNWYKNNPTVRVYEGSKARSFSMKGLPPDSGGGVPVDSGGGVPPDSGGGEVLNVSELLGKLSPNNPSSITHKKRTLSKKGDIFNQQLKDPEAEKRRQIRDAKKAGIL